MPDPPKPLPAPMPNRALEWFELACAGGALAHTDLDGLVEPGEPQEVRTAAMRMFRANYRGNRAETIEGIPIKFRRDKPHTEEYEALCAKEKDLAGSASTDAGGASEISDRDVEAQWTSDGATCVSHSRMWMRDGVIPAAAGYHGNLQERELAFLDDVKQIPPVPGGPDLAVPCDASAEPSPSVWFTSGVFHHIEHKCDQGSPGRSDLAQVSKSCALRVVVSGKRSR